MTINGIEVHKNLYDIPNGSYKGYYWLSGSDEPIIVDGDVEKIRNFKPLISYQDKSCNLFIVEGMLWDATNEISIMISHRGKYNIIVYRLKDIRLNEDLEIEPQVFLAHKLKDINYVSFSQLWLPETDSLCEGMKVLRMQAQIFCGIGKKDGNGDN